MIKMPIVSTDISDQMNEDLNMLVAAGLYKSKSEALRDAIRTLSYKYRENIDDLKEMRSKMKRRNGKGDLSGVLQKMREEEMQ